MIVMIVGALALLVVVPAVASARVAWHSNYQPVTSAVPTEWSGKIKQVDTVEGGAEDGVECSDQIEGSAASGGAGEVTKVTTSKCKGLGDICFFTEKNTAITALNLPWRTELKSVGGALRNVLVSSGKGTPGLKLECKTLIGAYVEECTGTLSTSTTNTESGVTAAFINSEKLSCTNAGKVVGTGSVEGSQSIIGKYGTLSAMLEEPVTSWEANKKQIEKNMASSWTNGTLTMYANTTSGGKLGVRCEDSGYGIVGAGGTGTITSMTFTKCAQAPDSECNGEYAIEAKNLPWTTGLILGIGNKDIENWVTGGSGKPTLTLKCEIKGLKGDEAKCETFASGFTTSMANAERGVLAEFRPTELTCKGTLTSGGGEINASSYTLQLLSGETLQIS